MSRFTLFLVFFFSLVPRIMAYDYTAWSSHYKLTGTASDDQDHDGKDNWTEFVFCTDPTQPSGNPLKHHRLPDGGIELRWQMRTSILGQSVYHVESSTDLHNWTRIRYPLHVDGSLPEISLKKIATRLPAPLSQRAFYRIVVGPPRLHPVVQQYHTATGISASRCQELSDFYEELEAIGLADHLVDAGFYDAASQPASQTTAFSLRGGANLNITGSPTRHRNGFLFTNDDPTSPSVPQYFSGALPPQIGEWTILTVALRDKEASMTGQRRAFNAFQTTPLTQILQMQNGTNWQSYSYANGSAASINGPLLPADPRFRPVAMRNFMTPAEGSFSSGVINDDFDALSTTGRGAVPFDKLVIGAGSTNGNSFNFFYDGMVSLWMIFDQVLSDQSLRDLSKLIDRSVAPKVRWVIDGDSISQNNLGWSWGLQTAPEWLGRNIELLPIGLGGETSIGAVAKSGMQGARFFLPTNAADGDRLTAGATTYTFRNTLSMPHDVKIGHSASATLNNLLAAFQGGSGAGSAYGIGTLAHPLLSAVPSGNISNIYLLRDVDSEAVELSENGSGYLFDMESRVVSQTVPLGPCAQFADPEHPTWYLVQCGSNDPGDTPAWQETFSNLQALWAAARSSGMKVVATTIPGATNYDSGYWFGNSGDLRHEARHAINAAIRADLQNYDLLLDIDALLLEAHGPEYWQKPQVLADGVHPSPATRKEMMDELWKLVAEWMP